MAKQATDTTVKKSVVKERQRIADAVVALTRAHGYQSQARTAWAAIFPSNDPALSHELRDSNGRTVSGSDY